MSHLPCSQSSLQSFFSSLDLTRTLASSDRMLDLVGADVAVVEQDEDELCVPADSGATSCFSISNPSASNVHSFTSLSAYPGQGSTMSS